MSDLLDKDTKNFLLILGGIVLFMMFIFPRINDGLLTVDLTGKKTSPLIGGKGEGSNKVTLDTKKDYSSTVSTSAGDFKMDLFEKTAPVNVSNFIDQKAKYKDATILTQKDFLFKIDAKNDSSKGTNDEINADYLGLQNIKVKDVKFLKELYDPSDSSSKAFSPENLQKYEEFTLKEFYSDVLKYSFDKELNTPSAKMYVVYMASDGPNTNKTDFFVLMSNAAQNVDGRYTPIGQVTEGFETLDKINNSQNNEVKINSVNVESK